jgi:hypothetical protein
MFTNVKYKKEKGREKKVKSQSHTSRGERKKEEEERVCFGISFLKDVTEKERDLAMLLHEPSITRIQSPSRQTKEREREREREKKADGYRVFLI